MLVFDTPLVRFHTALDRRWAWRLVKVTVPRLLASNVPTANPQATLSLNVNVARAGG